MAGVRARARGRKQAADTQAKYDAAGYGRRIKSWNPSSAGPQRTLEGFERLRARALDSIRNDWAGSSSVQKWTTSMVGVGIQPRWENQKHRDIWDDFGKQSDADGVLDIYGQQALLTSTWIGGGECWVRRRLRPVSSGLKIPLQIQLVESHYVPMIDLDVHNKMPAGNTIRQGVERTRNGQRAAIWMHPEHPGDPTSRNDVNLSDLIRVPWSGVRQVYEPKRTGQLRGVSELASVLVKLRASMDFEDAVLDRQKLANLFVGWLKRQMPPDWADIETDSITGLPKWYDSEGRSVLGLEPGIMNELMPGEDMQFANPPEAGTTYSEYMRTSHMGTAAGQGLPYELMSGDIKDISDRTLRIVVNEFRRFCEQRQWLTLVPMGLQPIVEWVGQAAILVGRLSVDEYDEFIKPQWSPHGWEYIHPVQDVDAAIKARDAGLTSTSRIIAKRGDDPRIILAERQADEKSGLTPKPPPVVAPAAPAEGKPKPKAPDALERAQIRAYEAQALLADAQRTAPPPAPLEASEVSPWEHLATGLAGVQASVASVASGLAAFAARPTEIHNHIEPSPLAVHVDPTPVSLHVDPTPLVIEPSAVSVDVHVPAAEPPVVNVENVVNVEPAEVKVELPVRQTVNQIVRDQTGEIVNVTQTERTIQ